MAPGTGGLINDTRWTQGVQRGGGTRHRGAHQGHKGDEAPEIFGFDVNRI